MTQVNIGNTTERNYRYTMEPPQIKIEGSGNGIKTVVINLEQIGKDLSRPPSYLLKYFGYELGTLSKFDKKNDKYIIQGEWNSKQLLDILKKGFIQSFVLCGECGNPETKLIMQGKKPARECQACGYVTPLDPREKLYGFVEKDLKQQQRKNKSSKKSSTTTNISKSDLTATQILKETVDVPQRVSDSIIIRKIFAIKEQKDLTGTDVMQMICKALLTENVVNSVVERVDVLEKFTSDSKRCQRVLLRHLETIASKDQDVLSKFARILFHLYEHDVLEENVILSWYQKNKPTKNLSLEEVQKIRESAKSFIEWLENAEEEEEEDDDDE